MINTAFLTRLDRTVVEKRAHRFAVVLWVVFWLIIGVTCQIMWNSFFGWPVGLIIGIIISLVATWIVYATPRAKSKRLISITWANDSINIWDPVKNKKSKIDLSKLHRAFIIKSKNENEILLRLEQLNDKNERTKCFDIISQVPIVLPITVSGYVATFLAFYQKAKNDISKASIPFRIKATGYRGSVITAELLSFVEKYRNSRNNIWEISFKGGLLRFEKFVFSFKRGSKEHLFIPGNEYSVLHMAKPCRNKSISSAQVFVALVPLNKLDDAIVFALIAPLEKLKELPSKWDISSEITKQHFTLYDDSPESVMVATTLKYLIKSKQPSHPVLDILRN